METKPTTQPQNGAQNASRVETARFALASSLWARGDHFEPLQEDAVTDLLTDLRHFCRAHGLNYKRCDRVAAMRFEDEAGGEP